MENSKLGIRAQRVCEKMVEARKRRKYTQEQVAKAIGINTGTYSTYERKVAEPSIDTITSLCLFYNESLDDWLGLNDKIKKSSTEVEDLSEIFRGLLIKDGVIPAGGSLTKEDSEMALRVVSAFLKAKGDDL